MKNKLKQTLALSLVFSMLSHTLVFASPQKAAIESAYQKLSVMLASPEFTEEDLQTELKVFQNILLETAPSKEEFEILALKLAWVSPTFDFENMWAALEGLQTEDLTLKDGSYDLEALQALALTLQGQTGNDFLGGGTDPWSPQPGTSAWAILAASVGVTLMTLVIFGSFVIMLKGYPD